MKAYPSLDKLSSAWSRNEYDPQWKTKSIKSTVDLVLNLYAVNVIDSFFLEHLLVFCLFCVYQFDVTNVFDEMDETRNSVLVQVWGQRKINCGLIFVTDFFFFLCSGSWVF